MKMKICAFAAGVAVLAGAQALRGEARTKTQGPFARTGFPGSADAPAGSEPSMAAVTRGG